VYYPAEQYERDNQNSTDALTLCIELNLMTNLRCCCYLLPLVNLLIKIIEPASNQTATYLSSFLKLRSVQFHISFLGSTMRHIDIIYIYYI